MEEEEEEDEDDDEDEEVDDSSRRWRYRTLAMAVPANRNREKGQNPFDLVEEEQEPQCAMVVWWIMSNINGRRGSQWRLMKSEISQPRRRAKNGIYQLLIPTFDVPSEIKIKNV